MHVTLHFIVIFKIILFLYTGQSLLDDLVFRMVKTKLLITPENDETTGSHIISLSSNGLSKKEGCIPTKNCEIRPSNGAVINIESVIIEIVLMKVTRKLA